jgi:hypothetical protein
LAVIFKVAASRVGPVQLNAPEVRGVTRLRNSGTAGVPVHAGREREGKVSIVRIDTSLGKQKAMGSEEAIAA